MRWIITITLALSSLFAGAQQCAIDETLKLGNALVTELENRSLEVVRIEYEWLSPDKMTNIAARSFSSEYKYFVIAFTTGSLSEFKMEIYEEQSGNWNIISSGQADPDNHSVVLNFEPSDNAVRMINIAAEASNMPGNGAFVGLIVAHDMGASKKGTTTTSTTSQSTDKKESVNISLNTKTYGKWSSQTNSIEVISTNEESSQIHINNAMTKMVHETQYGRTEYRLTDSKKTGESNWELSAEAPDGQKYTILVVPSERKLTFVWVENQQPYLYIWNIDQVWSGTDF